MKLLKLVPDDTNIAFLRWRVPFFAISVLLIAASWALVFTKGLNYGVDFAGGLEVRATFTQTAEAPVGDLRDQVATLGYGDPVVQRFGEDNQVSIRVRLPDEVSALDEGSVRDRAASPARPRGDGEAEDDVSDLGSPRVILDDDVSELTEARA